jgi:hypothetical protein
MATTGEIRAARRAAPNAATTVTTSPTATATTKVRADRTVGPSGTVAPTAPSRLRSPLAATIPVPMPAAEPARPRTAASPRIEARTCRPVAPAARITASSRVRWVTSTENVLAMRNAPMTSAAPASARSAAVM